jgi:arginine exporter protein ArgO
VYRKDTLNAFSKADPANGEGFVDSTSLAGNDDPGKYLDTLLVSFLNPSVYPDTVAYLEVVAIRFNLLLRDFVNDGIHF